MFIYFACSITGGRQDQQVYGEITEALLGDGHEVPTAVFSRPGAVELEQTVSAEDVFRRDMEWLKTCDALVAEVSTPSHGVGYEVAWALSLGKPVLCCYQRGRRVSKMITGNAHPCLRLSTYDTPDEAVAAVRGFLKGL
ncbi:MAG TPA: nucleoside 2-deoxyribosyltransferase [Anaerolineaceae bacterium]|nr:nucleoside 2-deoxyribosyltransferase [Anaerolineaceae bacterium]